MTLKELRKKCSDLEKQDKEIFDIASCIPVCEGTGTFNDDVRDYLENVISIYEDIEAIIKRRCTSTSE